MVIGDFFSEKNGSISFTRQQGSDFAKQVADDFNPLHDADAKRFCIPGDLLFAIILSKYGLSRHMEFTFSGMVMAGTELVLPDTGPQLLFQDVDGKLFLRADRSGENTRDQALIRNLTDSYVRFSGHTFPDILVPLLARQNVMINPQRPMVIYESMQIDLDTLDITEPVLRVDKNELKLDGKRGNVLLSFNLVEGDALVGRGRKHMVLGGLRDYDEATMNQALEVFDERKRALGGG